MPGFNLDSQMDELVASYLHDRKTLSSIVIPQFIHRQALVKEWSPEPGSRLLDIGCGQGECSLVLALAVGSSGHVTGIDSAPADYGGPYTVGQAQQHIMNSALAKRIAFQRTDAVTFLQSPSSRQQGFDAAVLCHSLWYFDNGQSISAMLQMLATAGIQRLYLAEYSLQASIPEQVPHVLAALAQRRLADLQKPRQFSGTRERNVCTAIRPEDLIRLAQEVGWSVKRQGIVTSRAELMDGHWESKYVTMDYFVQDVASESLDAKSEAEVLAFVPKVKKAINQVNLQGGQRMRTMDVWWAVLEL